MNWTRRSVVGLGAAWLLGGCAAGGGGRTARRPDTLWPSEIGQPRPDAGVEVTVRSPVPNRPTPTQVSTADPAKRGLTVIGRNQWATRGPIMADINPMRGISRITVHHEGSTPVFFTDTRATAARIEKVRRIHTEDRGWSDIGYHYIIDRAGRVWQGRPINYQGAHVRDQNENNLGILVLGNFDKQSASQAQLAKLVDTLRTFQSQYRVPTTRVLTHQELAQTACPGRTLQAGMTAIRSRYLG